MVCGEHVEVGFQFLIEITVEALRAQERSDPSKELPEPRQHGLTPGRHSEQPADRARNAQPVFRLGGELLTARPGYRVVLRFAVILRRAPFGRDPTLLQEAYKAEINRSLIDPESFFANLLDPSGDAVAVHRAHSV